MIGIEKWDRHHHANGHGHGIGKGERYGKQFNKYV